MDNVSFFLLQRFYIVFYYSCVTNCKEMQKTIVLSSGPFMQIFTFTYIFGYVSSVIVPFSNSLVDEPFSDILWEENTKE